MTKEIHARAGEISKNGFVWKEDGQALLDIMRLLDAQIPKKLSGPDETARLQEYLLASIKLLDRIHGWAMRGGNQMQEDALYGMFVNLYMKDRTGK